MRKIVSKRVALVWHKRMWLYIAHVIETNKSVMDIAQLKQEFCHNNGFYNLCCDCFLCEYDNDLCRSCPVMWGDSTEDRCNRLRNGGLGLYSKVKSASSWEYQAKLARNIANLPER